MNNSVKDLDVFIQVTNLKTGKVSEFPTISLCAVELRVTYPSLYYHLSKKGPFILRGTHEIKKVSRRKFSNRPYSIQLKDKTTGKLFYFFDVNRVADYLNTSPATLKKKLQNRKFLHFNEKYVIYRIG